MPKMTRDGSVDRRPKKVWIGGSECSSILDGLAMLRLMAADPDIPYHVLYHAIAKGHIEVRGVSVSTSAPHSCQERPCNADQPPRPVPGRPDKKAGPLLARIVTSWLGPHH